MKIKHMTFNYHIDISKDLYAEYRADVDEAVIEAALRDGILQAEFFIDDLKGDWKMLWNKDFSFDAKRTTSSMFDVNFYQVLKEYRGNRITEIIWSHIPVDDRWMYYEREFYATIPVLLYWGHASLKVKMEGVGSNGKKFVYEYESWRTETLSVDGQDKEEVKLFCLNISLRELLELVDAEIMLTGND